MSHVVKDISISPTCDLPNGKLAFFVLLILFFLSYGFNFFGFSNQDWYSGFQKDSEELVINSIVAEKYGVDKHGRGLLLLNQHGNGDAYKILGEPYRKDFFISDANWTNGISNSFHGFMSPNYDFLRRVYTEGRNLRLPNGNLERVLRTEEHGPYLYVYLEGSGPLKDILDGKSPAEILYFNGSDYVPTIHYQLNFGNYDSQFGLQGRAYSIISKLLNYPSVGFLRMITAMLTAFVLAALVCLYYQTLGKEYTLCSLFVLISSPWLISFSPNLYWAIYLWFLPAVISLWLLKSMDSSILKKSTILLFIVAAVFVKCLCGYEYITSIILFANFPFLAAPLLKLNYSNYSRYIKFWAAVLVASIIGFALAISFHAEMRADSLIDGIRIIFEADVKRRTYGNPADFDPVYRDSLTIPVIYVIRSYLSDWGTDLFFYLPGYFFKILFSVVFFYLLIQRVINKSTIHLVFLFAISIAVPLSWFILAKGHSHIHKHMNFVLWYMSFIPTLIYIFGTIAKNIYKKSIANLIRG